MAAAKIYEGQIDYRCDPVAVAFIFGLKSLEKINQALSKELFKRLTEHF
ncbi:MAG: hypothetical protein OEQ53_02655 [Saprospiraceae bacterium]|nr:hypothetical protein [Saprospiraceae bacterium]